MRFLVFAVNSNMNKLQTILCKLLSMFKDVEANHKKEKYKISIVASNIFKSKKRKKIRI